MRLIVFILLSINILFSIEGYWTYEEEFSLKKDEFVLYKVKEKELLFRWTLFHNNGLVYIAKYDMFPYQGILYKRYRLDSFQIKTGRNSIAGVEDPYCMITFKKFNVKTKRSDFKIYCRDTQGAAPIVRITGK